MISIRALTFALLSLGAAAAVASSAAGDAAAAAAACAPASHELLPLPQPRFDDGPVIGPADLLSDFEGWLAAMRALNPALELRADMPALARVAAEIRTSLRQPLSRRAAWARFALLNPHLGDGHSGVFMPNYRGALQAHLSGGGRVLPVDVRFGRDGSLRVFAGMTAAKGVQRGDRLLGINGRPVAELLEQMLQRAPGDSVQQQRAWVARRFAALYWHLYGDTREYDLLLQPEGAACPRASRLDGATTLPMALQPNPPAADVLSWRLIGDVGYLRVDSFDADFQGALADMARQAFARFTQARVRAVVIDVRENGGGDDPPWQQSLMEHIASRPYAQLSSYAVRVTQENARPGESIGEVRHVAYDKRFTPTPDNPLRFTGPVYILVGPYSYSSAIQFAVAAQDFGAARIAGEETGGLACQTGKTRSVAMPRTGLAAVAPSIAFTRPSGEGCRHGVLPDVPVPVDDVDPDQTLRMLLERIGEQALGR
jgi:C-terminal processing protease CtpA/Prc